MSDLTTAAIIGGTVYLATRDGGEPVQITGPAPKLLMIDDDSVGPQLEDPKYVTLSTEAVKTFAGNAANTGGKSGSSFVVDPRFQTQRYGSGNLANPYETALLDELKRMAAAEWDKMECEGRKAGLQTFRQAFPDAAEPGFDICAAEWKQIFEYMGAVMGADAGTEICKAIGLGPLARSTCGVVGAFIGKWVGGKVGPFFQKAYDKAIGAGKKVGEKVEDAFQSSWDFVSGGPGALWEFVSSPF